MSQRHPDWNFVHDLVFLHRGIRWVELRNYVKSHHPNNCTNEFGNNVLMVAIIHNNQQIIKELFDLSYLDPNITNHAGQTALELAIQIQPSCLNILHRYHMCIDFEKAKLSPNELDAMFAAIYFNNSTTIQNITGVDISGNQSNIGGWTALMCATRFGRSNCILALHKKFPNLNPNQTNIHNISAIELAIIHNHPQCIYTLYECFPSLIPRSSIVIACNHDRPECIIALSKCFPQLNPNITSYWKRTALIYATMRNHTTCVRLLYTYFSNIDVNVQDEDGNTALLIAIQYQQGIDCIYLLAKYFHDTINPNKTNNQGDTALLVAIRYNWIDCINELITYFPFIDINAQNQQGKNALMIAIELGHIECITTLCSHFTNINPLQQDIDGNSLLILTIQGGNLNCLKQLHSSGLQIDPNQQNNQGETALIVALQSHCSDSLLQCILEYFPTIDVEIENNKGQTALQIAIEYGHIHRIQLLLDHFSHITVLHQTKLFISAAKTNRIELVPILKRLFPLYDINIGDIQHITPLHYAIEYCNYQFIIELCQNYPSLDPNVKTNTGLTPLMISAQKQSVICINTLHQCFPNIDPNCVESSYGNSALMIIASASSGCRNAQYMTLLCQLFPTIDPTICNTHLQTALHLALERGNIRVLRQLLQFFKTQLNPNVQDYEGNSALMIACKRQDYDSIILLHDHFPQSIDIHCQNQAGKTALILAYERHNTECIVALHHFIDIGIEKFQGNTSFLHFVKNQQIEIVRQLLMIFASYDDDCMGL